MLGAVLVVVLQVAMIVSAGAAFPSSAAPQIGLSWGGGLDGCPQNSTGFGYLNYSIRLTNIPGPDGYAVLGLGVNHVLVRYWAIYVPAGTWNQRENVTYAVRCDAYQDSGIALVTAVAA